jgi:hypothetical protein
MYKFKPESTLSPSFWESEGKNADDRSGFDAIMPGIEHPLGLKVLFGPKPHLAQHISTGRAAAVHNRRRGRCCPIFPWPAPRLR